VRKLLPIPPLQPSIFNFIVSSSSKDNNGYLPHQPHTNARAKHNGFHEHQHAAKITQRYDLK
jgi:hypothetical protein